MEERDVWDDNILLYAWWAWVFLWSYIKADKLLVGKDEELIDCWGSHCHDWLSLHKPGSEINKVAISMMHRLLQITCCAQIPRKRSCLCEWVIQKSFCFMGLFRRVISIGHYVEEKRIVITVEGCVERGCGEFHGRSEVDLLFAPRRVAAPMFATYAYDSMLFTFQWSYFACTYCTLGILYPSSEVCSSSHTSSCL